MIIGIGIDLVEVDRVENSVKKFGDRFLRRVFTDHEIDYCQSKINSFQYFSVRFAAKEALLKAIGTGLRGGISWQEIEIVHDKLGKPSLLCQGRCGEVLHQLGAEKPILSLSHTGNYGIAVVILERSG